MPEYLVIAVGAGRDVPARVTGLLFPSDTEITGLQFRQLPDSGAWWIQLAVCSPPERLELVTKRLHRLVGVSKVVTVEADGHFRQSATSPIGEPPRTSHTAR